VNGSTNQYADDSTNYVHCKPKELPAATGELQTRLEQLQNWSNTNNLAFNEKKTKIILFSTPQMAKNHQLNRETHATFNITHHEKHIARETSYKLLGVHFDQHLNWEQHLNQLTRAIYGSSMCSGT